MQYVLKRADGVTITTMLPIEITLADGATLRVMGLGEGLMSVMVSETEEMLEVGFAGDIRDLVPESSITIGGAALDGRLVFAPIEDEIACMPKPSEIISAHPVDRSDIPEDFTFRDAWAFDGVISIDIDRARDIHKDRMRAVRAPLLRALDVEYQRADETGDIARKAEIVANKNALRDVTADPAISAALTPADLKAVWPSILPPRVS